MATRKATVKTALTVMMVVVITLFHYVTKQSAHYQHMFYQELYFVPLVLAAFWFGLRGGLITSVSISILYLPFIMMHWRDFSPEDFNRLLELVLYNAIAAIIGVLRDREQRRLDRLRETESLAAMGRALSGAAHDMKTPLVAIGGFSRLIQKHLSKYQCTGEEYCQEKLDIIIKETQRLENLVKDMLDFSKPLKLSVSREDICEIVGGSITIVEAATKEKKVYIRSELSDGIPPTFLDPMRMKQLFINLLANAIQASPEGEAVTIKCYRKGKNLVIDVNDLGPGIPTEKREKIFSPFFTTKKEGTGLGLPLAEKIVEAHRGRLQVRDNPDGGTTFRVVIPFDRGEKSDGGRS